MKKFFKILFVLLLILLVRFIIAFIINETVINNYNNKKYNDDLIKTLYIFNISESYIVYYNDGNISYMNNKYNDAIKKYNDALDRNPPTKRACDIRVNLSLAYLKLIDKNGNKDEILKKLDEIKELLLKDGCASESGNDGKSNDSEELKQEVEKLEEQIKNGNATNDNNNGNDNNGEDDGKYDEIEQKIKEQEKNANTNRQKDMSTYENLNSNQFYYGKKW